MKRINLAEDVKIAAVRTSQGRMRGTANGGEHGSRWVITITRGEKSFSFPYLRGGSLSNRDSIDVTAVFKATMLNMAVITLAPTKEDMATMNLEVDDHTLSRLTKLRLGLKDVLGEEFDRILNIVMANAQEAANEP